MLVVPTVKLTGLPALTVWLGSGWVSMVMKEFTVSTAGLLVTGLHVLVVATQVYVPELNPGETRERLSVVLV